MKILILIMTYGIIHTCHRTIASTQSVHLRLLVEVAALELKINTS